MGSVPRFTPRFTGLQKGLVITLDSSETFELNGVKVSVVPLYRWLLT